MKTVIAYVLFFGVWVVVFQIINIVFMKIQGLDYLFLFR